MRPFFLWDEKFIQHCERVSLWTLLKPAALIRSRSVLENPHNKINKTLKSVTDHRMRLLWPIRRERAWNIAQSFLGRSSISPQERFSLTALHLYSKLHSSTGNEQMTDSFVGMWGGTQRRCNRTWDPGFFNLFPSRQFHLARCEADAWRVRLHRWIKKQQMEARARTEICSRPKKGSSSEPNFQSEADGRDWVDRQTPSPSSR